MIITTIETVPGMTIEAHYGVVTGSTVRSKNLGSDFFAGIKNIFGGELKGYSHLLEQSREQAIERMTEQAQQAGANAVINVRLFTSSIAAGAAEVFAYGTAVKVR